MQLARKYGLDISALALKRVALAAMFVDHLATWLVQPGGVAGLLLHTFGRLAAPIMCFCIAQGFHHTRSVRRYLSRLLLFAALSHFPYVWYFRLTPYKTTGVFWSLALGLVALAATKQEGLKSWQKLLAVITCCVLALPGDWSYIAVLWIVAFGYFADCPQKQMAAFMCIGTLLYILPALLSRRPESTVALGILLAVPLLLCYSGRRGTSSPFGKWACYAFYPAHLLVLFLLRAVL